MRITLPTGVRLETRDREELRLVLAGLGAAAAVTLRMDSRPEVFDWQCKLSFYNGGPNEEEQRFLAVPENGTKIVLRGIMRARVPTMANRGRLLGIRGGSAAALWQDEAQKAGLKNSVGYTHDLIIHCMWYPDKIDVPEVEIAYWPFPRERAVPFGL